MLKGSQTIMSVNQAHKTNHKQTRCHEKGHVKGNLVIIVIKNGTFFLNKTKEFTRQQS